MNCKAYSKISDLLNELEKHINDDKPLIIGVDGAFGSGKTILSYCMGCRLKFTVISLDQYLNGEVNKGSYLSRIKYKDLEEYIKLKIKAERSIIIEGACLLKILNKIKIKHDILIYVKRMSCNNGTWCEEQELSGDGKILKNPNNDLEERLLNEIIQYHNEFKPYVNAHYCFERMEEAEICA